MATIVELVGYVIAGVALLHTLVQIISCLLDEESRVQLWTWIKDMVNNLPVAAPAPVPGPPINNNQTYNYTYNYSFNDPGPITINLGDGQAPELHFNQGYRPGQIAHRVAPSLTSSARPQIAYQAATDAESIPIARPKIANLAAPDVDPCSWLPEDAW